jgi:membrane associated rhomboid family serine protease
MDWTLKELLLGVGLSSAFVAGVIAIRASARPGSGAAPVLTFAAFFAIAPISLAQLLFAPHLLPWLMRDATQVYSGQPWRLLTSLFVQDGGWGGAAFNLAGLLAIGAVAERLLGRLPWLAVAAISVAGAQSLGLLWQPTGAGNSILNFGLAGAVCAVCLTVRPPQLLVPAVVATACFLLLLAARDIHGVAAVTGALATFAFSLRRRRQGESGKS